MTLLSDSRVEMNIQRINFGVLWNAPELAEGILPLPDPSLPPPPSFPPPLLRLPHVQNKSQRRRSLRSKRHLPKYLLFESVKVLVIQAMSDAL